MYLLIDNHYRYSFRSGSYQPGSHPYTHSRSNSQVLFQTPAGRLSEQHKDSYLSISNEEIFPMEFGQCCASQLFTVQTETELQTLFGERLRLPPLLASDYPGHSV
ncbi:hypothetical protein KIN20_036902 [Parelaphostrongylus tenuis]|uniref:Uncharacterized protein n=1 Tax=Parelaphostrongylus tenuis TaxID=148309 RepID=A0AAD5RDD0_PARTN|nr:hypothetical protein KIN20_036902 [Parelaphostrongylus tenuis]